MREIKFRGKRTDTGQWVYGDYFKAPLTDENSGLPPEAGWFFLCGEIRHCISQNGVAFTVDPSTVGQYTGLKDKTEQEIYEGDIMDMSFYGVVIIVWNEEICSFQFAYEGMAKGTAIGGRITNTLFDHEALKFKVIGNIHDNPELLES
jgi:uncharacterized phage protein (TIGR01671 family)